MVMATNDSSISGAVELPNPFTPMAFLPPEIAYQVTISTYIGVGSMGVCDNLYSIMLIKLIGCLLDDDLGCPQ